MCWTFYMEEEKHGLIYFTTIYTLIPSIIEFGMMDVLLSLRTFSPVVLTLSLLVVV